MNRIPNNNVIVIFGASGDLTHRKLIPALYNLANDGLLPPNFAVIGFARRSKTDETFRQECYEGVKEFSRSKPIDENVWAEFAKILHYHQGNYDNNLDYEALNERLIAIDKGHSTQGNRLYYIATPPEAYANIIEKIGTTSLTLGQIEKSWTRVIIEKPFGHDLQSAHELNKCVHRYFREDQIFRIDHYLGKETVQNILVFRFANGIFEPIWDRRYIDHVQITVAESIGVENRGSYYESAGVIRDMIQNHVLQLLALTAMEPPAEFEANAVRNEKVKILKAIRLDANHPEALVRGQYSPGKVNGLLVSGYTQEEGVALDSNTETYIAMKLLIDNWRWAGVPFYIRSGKRMKRRLTEIAIQFRLPPLMLFGENAAQHIEPNVLVITIQPDEGISLKFGAKRPGNRELIQPVVMDFQYRESVSVPAPEAYERLILDCMLGDSTLFTRSDEVEAAWSLVTPIIENLTKQQTFIEQYRSGSAGPKGANDMIASDSRKWREL
jgi:glucose-6-phosphate 1-dehydrogenase